MLHPNADVTRSAILVLPLPGAPYRKSPRPELTAGPSRLSILLFKSRSSNARWRSSGVGCCRVSDWASTLAT